MSKATHLTCCVCGADAGTFFQHWNRDDGFGICINCAAEQAGIESPERMVSLYGKPGLNYAQPMVTYLGRRFKLMAVFRESDVDRANAFMERTPGASVLVVDRGRVYIAHQDDKGEPV